jgi:hypothetical protein
MSSENQKASNCSSIGTAGSDHVDADMFDLAPVSLWLEDYSCLKTLFDGWRAHGVTRLRDYLRDFEDAPVLMEDYEEAARCHNRCAAAGVACSTVDMILCTLALRLDVPIFTTDPDFGYYAPHTGIRLHQPATRLPAT